MEIWKKLLHRFQGTCQQNPKKYQLSRAHVKKNQNNTNFSCSTSIITITQISKTFTKETTIARRIIIITSSYIIVVSKWILTRQMSNTWTETSLILLYQEDLSPRSCKVWVRLNKIVKQLYHANVLKVLYYGKFNGTCLAKQIFKLNKSGTTKLWQPSRTEFMTITKISE